MGLELFTDNGCGRSVPQVIQAPKVFFKRLTLRRRADALLERDRGWTREAQVVVEYHAEVVWQQTKNLGLIELGEIPPPPKNKRVEKYGASDGANDVYHTMGPSCSEMIWRNRSGREYF